MRKLSVILVVMTFPFSAFAADLPTCTYHDVHYSAGAMICVAPGYGQTCGKEGSWSTFDATSKNQPFFEACKGAPVIPPTENDGRRPGDQH
jgi:hypothetical protein